MQVVRIKYDIDDKELKDVEATVRRLDAEEKKAAKSFAQLGQSADNAAKQAGNGMQRLDNAVKGVGATIVAAFAVDRVLAFAKEVTAITGEFQKFEAVLTNTLGSKSIAQQVLGNIKQFAATTNFSVQELTAAYVKLANQGFKPTIAELRKLGDVANSTGKQFDQLAEAIIDAQTGEFERLKEFGIRASKEGEKVTFTFKEVKTQVDFTADAIRKYVLGLGDVEGVSGSTEAISKTLTTQISNLEDSYTQLLTALGDSNKGLISSSIKFLDTLLKTAAVATEIKTKFPDVVKVFGEEQTKKAVQEITEELAKYNLETELGIIQAIKFLKNEERVFDIFARGSVAYAERIRLEQLFVDVQQQNLEEELERLKKIEEAQKELEEKLKKSLDLLREEELESQKLTEKNRDEFNKLSLDQLKDHIKNKNEIIDGDQKEAREREEAEMQKAIDDNNMRLQLEQEYVDAKLALANTEIDGLANLSVAIRQLSADDQALAVYTLTIEKALKIAQVIMNAKAAIALATASAAPFTSNPITAGPAAALLAVNIAQVKASAAFAVAGIAATAIPEIASNFGPEKKKGFKDGVIDLQGPGTTKSDSIPAMLSKRESVMTAEETMLFKPTLMAIRERKVDPRILNNLALGRINEEALALNFKSAVSAIPVHQTYFDEDGVSRFIQKKNSRVQVLNKRYGRV